MHYQSLTNHPVEQYSVSCVIKYEDLGLNEYNEEEWNNEREKKEWLKVLTYQVHTLAYVYISVYNMITKIPLSIC